MTITYPRDIPSVMVIERANFGARSAVAVAGSIFTFEEQTQEHQGQTWAATIVVAPTDRADAAVVSAWGVSLRGRSKTFLLGDPLYETPRGSASTSPGTPVVSGASQTGASVTIQSAPASAQTYLLPGDYFQLGNGLTSRLHKVLSTVITTAAGSATIDIWPDLRSSPANGATVIVSSARGAFRLADNTFSWDERTVISGFEFGATEVLG